MYNINVCLDSVGYKSKPTGNEIGHINNRIGKSSSELNCPSSFRAFAYNVGQNGHTFSPSTFSGGTRNEKNFEQMQLLVLDFDGGISYEKVKARAKQYNLPIVFSYETFTSEDDNEKFRVVFISDVPIQDKKGAKILKYALMEIFPETDKHDSDVSRMYFGGTKVIDYNSKLPTVSPDSIFRSMTHYLLDDRKANHYKDHIKKFAKKHGIKLTKRGLLDVSVNEMPTESDGKLKNRKFVPSAIIMKDKLNGENFPNIYYQINLDDGVTNNTTVEEKQPKQRNRHRSSSIKELFGMCQLLQEFKSGERKLHHSELFGISTNIIHVESGIERFKKIMSEYPEYYDRHKQDRFSFYLKYNKEMDYKPSDCNNFCPYKDTCKHGRNILLTVKPERGTMERIANHTETYHTIEEVQNDLKQKLVQAIKSNDKLWHIIKAQTAAGKSETFLRLMASTRLRFLIAVPTNKLKWDIKNRADEKGIELMVTPSLDEIKNEIPAYIWKHICHLRDTGQHSKVHPFIWRMAEEEGVECLQKHLQQQQKYEEHSGHTITTHRRFLNMSEKALAEYDAVIIDEDIILGSIASNQCEIPLTLLRKIYKKATAPQYKTPSQKMLAKKVLKILHRKKKTLLELPGFEWEDDTEEDGAKNENEDVDGIPALTDIPSFCLAEHFIYRKASEEENLSEDCIVFLKPWKFKNIKHIMVSATVDKDICEHCFGKNKVKFYDCKTAKYAGEINQYPEKSMSRSCIDGIPGILDEIKKWSGFEHMITFKKYGTGDMYFGNAIGCDHLKGQNINVVGTPYQVEFVYKLLPFTLGLDISEDAKMKTHLVTHNGYRFYFKTYDDEEDVLRKFHFWMIESELEQAVGRARLLRKRCTVNLFSNFPIRQAVIKKFKHGDDDVG